MRPTTPPEAKHGQGTCWPHPPMRRTMQRSMPRPLPPHTPPYAPSMCPSGTLSAASMRVENAHRFPAFRCHEVRSIGVRYPPLNGMTAPHHRGGGNGTRPAWTLWMRVAAAAVLLDEGQGGAHRAPLISAAGWSMATPHPRAGCADDTHAQALGGGGAWEDVQHRTGTQPNRPSLSVARTVGRPVLDSEPQKPPQTRSETGAVKLPRTMPMPMHTCIHHHVNAWSWTGRGGLACRHRVLFSSAAGGTYRPIAIRCPCLGPFPSAGGGAHRPLTALCPSSPSLAYPFLSTSLSFPFGLPLHRPWCPWRGRGGWLHWEHLLRRLPQSIAKSVAPPTPHATIQ